MTVRWSGCWPSSPLIGARRLRLMPDKHWKRGQNIKKNISRFKNICLSYWHCLYNINCLLARSFSGVVLVHIHHQQILDFLLWFTFFLSERWSLVIGQPVISVIQIAVGRTESRTAFLLNCWLSASSRQPGSDYATIYFWKQWRGGNVFRGNIIHTKWIYTTGFNIIWIWIKF